jgi:hypothetical protein
MHANEVKLEKVSTRDLLAEYTALVNRYGVDSEQAALFIENNKADKDFVQLAETARWLKKALNAPAINTDSKC